jgi:hypothetical protein
LEQNWNALPEQSRYPACLLAHSKCDALLVDLNGDGRAEILIIAAPFQLVTVYSLDAGKWSLKGTLAASNCKGVQDALRKGDFETVTPELKELKAAGYHLPLMLNCAPDGTLPRGGSPFHRSFPGGEDHNPR